mmetsp:Transcript_88721/g.206479  ORF Transcript_88721/g.206479 Transcript_88721/m.206479 type:complete len:105 (+) Transcript_88721:313-627(+)
MPQHESKWSSCVPLLVPVLESMAMSHDVPYGANFHVVTTDSFSVVEDTGHVKLVRRCGLDWMKPLWLKALVESASLNQTADAGHKVAAVVRRWAQAQGGSVRAG